MRTVQYTLDMTIKERMAAIERYEPNEETKEFAAYCLQQCVEWFGAPPDLARPYKFETELLSCCTYHFLEKTYIIAFALADRFEVSKDRHWWVLAHEMYHRCTMRRRGMRRYVWVDEMLACAAAFHICRTIPEWTQKNETPQVSFSQFLAQTNNPPTPEPTPTEEILNSYLLYKPSVNLPRWMRIKRGRLLTQVVRMIWFQRKRGQGIESLYPKGFSDWVVQLGEALRYVISWEQLCSLAFAKNLNSWLDSLPAMERDFVEILLKRKEPDLGRLALYPSHVLLGFGYALALMHEYDMVFALYLRVEQQNRVPSQEYRYLSYILTKRGIYDKVAYCEQKAFDLGLQDDKARIDLAYALVMAEQYAAALPHIEFVLSQEHSEFIENAKEYHEIVAKELGKITHWQGEPQ